MTALAFLPNQSNKPPVVAPLTPTSRRAGERVKLFGEVDPKGPISLAAVKEQFADLNPNAPKTLVINSSGGDTGESFKIYHWLKALPVPLMAIAERRCQSAALTIFMAADLRVADPSAEFLLHRAHMSKTKLPQTLNSRELVKYAADLRATDDRVLDLLEARTGFDRGRFEAEIDDEDILSEADAIQSGIVHEWLGSNRCSPRWIEDVGKFQSAKMALPSYLTTPNFFAACRAAAHFPTIEVEGSERP